MKCYSCGEEMIWNNDFDIDEENEGGDEQQRADEERVEISPGIIVLAHGNVHRDALKSVKHDAQGLREDCSLE